MKQTFSRGLLGILLCASVVRAEGTDPREQARQHYARGLELSGQGDYTHALAEFLAAYQTRPHFAVLYNIGQAYVALGRPSDAVAALEQYLREGKEQIASERLAQTAAQIASQKAETAEVLVLVNAPDASIRIDGQEVGRAPLSEALRVAPGAHVVAVSAANRPEVTRSVSLLPGQHLDLRIDLPMGDGAPLKSKGTLNVVCPAPNQVWVDDTPIVSEGGSAKISLDAGPHRIFFWRAGHHSPEQRVGVEPGSIVIFACAEAGPVPANPDKTRSHLPTIGYVLGGLGVGLGAAAVGHYLWNRGRYEDWQRETSALSDPNANARRQRQIDNNDLAASIDRASRVTVTLAMSGGALLATGSTLVVLDAGSPKKDRLTSGMSVSLCGVW